MVIDEQSKYSDGAFQIFKDGPNPNPLFKVTRNGHVTIGTGNIDTNYKLAVNGKMRAKEIVCETGWSDFVFEDDYDLPTLKEVEDHIEKHGHLKDIPSAAEVEANGVSLGEMDSKLLQKIEELTLYIIELKKENDKQQTLIESLLSKQTN